ncbi:group II intron reverse transcriptase/maturase, partial [Klebsiella pneumoniae]
LHPINIIYLNKLSNQLPTPKFKFKPITILNIPKPKPPITPLTLPNPTHKILQQLITIILHTIFHKNISTHSHPFTNNITSQTPISQLTNIFPPTNSFIQLHLKKSFHTISHHLIIKQLKTYISHKHFIHLLYKLLTPPYIHHKPTYHKPILPLPQPSLITPILSNILITFLHNSLQHYINLYNKPKLKKQHPTYKKLSTIIPKPKIFSTTLKLHKQTPKPPLFIYNHPNFNTIKYLTYPHHILIPLLPSKNHSKIIKTHLNNFLNSLPLTINQQKTLITSPTQLPPTFLPYNISITPLKTIPTLTKLITPKLITTTNTTTPIINPPITHIINKLPTNSYSNHNKNPTIPLPTTLPKSLYQQPTTIINNYKALGRGMLN